MSAASDCTVRGEVNRIAGAAGAAGLLEDLEDFFLARVFDADDLVFFFFVPVPVCPSEETAMNEASATTAIERMVRYNVLLIECELST
jgi:hypothetical protein